MKNGSRLRKGREPEVEGRKRRRLLYLGLAILILLALCCVVMGTVTLLGQAPLGPASRGGYEKAEPEEGAPGERSDGFLGFRVHGQAIHALNMAPGDWVTSDFALENLGPGAMRVVVTARVVSDNGLCQALQISLLLTRQHSSEESDVIYYGPLTELYRKPDQGLSLSAEGSERLIWSVYFPFESGNQYQAVQCRVDFVFEAQRM